VSWLLIAASLITVTSCSYIPFGLLHLVRVRRDLPFSPRFWCVFFFVIVGGTTALLDALSLWWDLKVLILAHRLLLALVSSLLAYYTCRVFPHDGRTPSPISHASVLDQLRYTEGQLELARARVEQLAEEAAEIRQKLSR